MSRSSGRAQGSGAPLRALSPLLSEADMSSTRWFRSRHSTPEQDSAQTLSSLTNVCANEPCWRV